MPKKVKTVKSRKTKTKQTVNVNVVVNSNNKRKVVSSGKANQQPQTVYIPASSSQHTPVILKSEPQKYPATQTDIDSYIETQVKKYATPQKSLLNSIKDDIPTYTAPIKNDVGTPVPIKPETRLTSGKERPTPRILEPREVHTSTDDLPTSPPPLMRSAGTSHTPINLPQIRAYLKAQEGWTQQGVNALKHADKSRFLTPEYQQKIINWKKTI